MGVADERRAAGGRPPATRKATDSAKRTDRGGPEGGQRPHDKGLVDACSLYVWIARIDGAFVVLIDSPYVSCRLRSEKRPCRELPACRWSVYMHLFFGSFGPWELSSFSFFQTSPLQISTVEALS